MSQTPDSADGFLYRSLIAIEAVPPEQGGGVLLACDCGTATHLVVDTPSGPGKYELAVTCGGCSTPSWLTVTVAGD